ncbi:hypothetical protein [Serratia fonticola]|uniref:hypothetical protein n=1 Tax=Serratia fonticola TaxID=47917 RepID=UPI0021BDE3D5|nr:hypothetical protein [Serratia fonticola]
MIKITHLKSSIVISLFLIVPSWQATGSEKTDENSFWRFINNVKLQLPEGLAQVTHLFNNAFVIQDENDQFISYKSKGFILDGKVNIESIEARVFHKNNKNAPYLLALQVSGICITLSELKQYYSDLTITDVPRGRSLVEETTYSTVRYSNNVKLAFGFAEKKPDCLGSVVFSTD